MFNKKTCKKCGKKINSGSNFCSNCGFRMNDSKEDYGMLGKNDFLDERNDSFENSFFGGFGGNIMNKMLNNAMKMLDKEMQKSMREPNQPKSNFELFVNGKRISPENIKVTRKPVQGQVQKVERVKIPIFDSDTQKKFLKLSKNEPKTNLRRLSDKVIYELEIPGVESIKDISIVNLENSIEIKAVAKDRAYEKIIPFSMPLSNYYLEKGILVLELKS